MIQIGDCQYANNFSYDGRKAMFDYFEQHEEDCEEEIEFDGGIIIQNF